MTTRASTARSTFRRLAARLRRQDGMQLVELLVGAAIMGVVALIAVTVIFNAAMLVTRSSATTATLSDLQDASGQLLRDVNDGRKILVAGDDAITVQVVRDSVCTQREWSVQGQDLQVTTTTYSTDSCSGGAVSNSTMAVVDNQLVSARFDYFSALSQRNAMSQPVYLSDVTRVTWDLVALPGYKNAVAKEITSGAAFTGRGASSDGTGAVQDAIAPQLRVVSSPDVFDSRIGVDAPVLAWVDKTPELTSSWTVYRIANPEGGGSGASTTWTAVMRLGADATTVRDVSLPDGYSVQYIVAATLKDGRDGPSSNQVATGLRPAVPAITATGQPTAIALSWTRTDGADSWDLYRDGSLYKSWPSMKTTATVGSSTVAWTDPTGTGHAHSYAVVAVNRWERAATVTSAQGVHDPGAQTNQLEVGTDAAAALGAPGLTATRLVSTASGAWSAPLAPTAVTATNRQPADIDNPASTWETVVDVSWTPSVWTGGYSAAAAEATRYALTRGSTTVRSGVQDTKASDDGNAPRGATSTYRVVASTLAPNPLTGGTGTTSVLTWPAAPSCTATPGGGGQPATRAATVTVAAPGGQTVASLRQRIRTGEIRNTGTDAWTTLAHSTTHYWRGQAQNAGGYGPWSPECSATTDVLAIHISGASWTTRSIVADADATNGTSRSIGVDEKGYSVPGTHLEYDQLEDGQPWTVTASNTDGFNTVTDRRSGSAGVPNSTNDPGFRTPPLVAPTPTCAATVTDSQAPGAITVGGGDQVKLGSGGTVCAGPRSYSGLAAGTYVGYARNVISDGHNSATSGWDACPGRSVVNPPPVTRGSGLGGQHAPQCSSHADDSVVRQRMATSATSSSQAFWGGAGHIATADLWGDADEWAYLSGSAAAEDLSCSFARRYTVLDAGGYVLGYQWGTAIWSLTVTGTD